MDKRGLYYQLVKRQTKENEPETTNQLITDNKTTIPVGIPLTAKKYSTSFKLKKSI